MKIISRSFALVAMAALVASIGQPARVQAKSSSDLSAGTNPTAAVNPKHSAHPRKGTHFGFVPPPPATMPSPTALALVERGAGTMSVEPSKPVPLTRRIKLLGIVGDTGIFCGPAGSFRMNPGQEIDSVRLVSLSADRAVLEQEGDRVTLVLK